MHEGPSPEAFRAFLKRKIAVCLAEVEAEYDTVQGGDRQALFELEATETRVRAELVEAKKQLLEEKAMYAEAVAERALLE